MAMMSRCRVFLLFAVVGFLSFACGGDSLRARVEDPEKDDRGDRIARYRKQLASKDPKERATAANQLGHLGATEATGELKDLLRDDSAEVQYFALGALIDLDAEGLAADARRFLDAPQPNLRIVAAQALLASGEKQATEQVLRLLEDSDSYVRQNLLLLLGVSRVTEAVPALEKLLASSDRSVRFQAMSALGMIGQKESGPSVAKHLEDPDPEIQSAALQALGQIDPARYQNELRKALKSDSGPLRSAALAGLVRVQDPEALKITIESRKYDLLNYYHAPSTVSLLENTRIPRKLIRRRSVAEILGVLSDKTGIKMEPSKRIGDDLLAAHYGPNFGFLGTAPPALAVLGSFNQWFLSTRSKLAFVVEKDLVRVVTPEEAKEFWESYIREKASK
jgi:HEAT repeat protein